jgi:carbonic anhydrase/acetyltransferase-like protein (isoleucine patch superfamily)
MLLKSGSHHPSIDPSAVIAPNATLVGDVRIGARCVPLIEEVVGTTRQLAEQNKNQINQ